MFHISFGTEIRFLAMVQNAHHISVQKMQTQKLAYMRFLFCCFFISAWGVQTSLEHFNIFELNGADFQRPHVRHKSHCHMATCVASCNIFHTPTSKSPVSIAIVFLQPRYFWCSGHPTGSPMYRLALLELQRDCDTSHSENR